jgi:hypothetical protein
MSVKVTGVWAETLTRLVPIEQLTSEEEEEAPPFTCISPETKQAKNYKFHDFYELHRFVCEVYHLL